MTRGGKRALAVCAVGVLVGVTAGVLAISGSAWRSPAEAQAPSACAGSQQMAADTVMGGAAPVDLSDVTFSGPITITQGGSYTGNWESTDPAVPAVRVMTDQPVVIDGARLRSRGDVIEGSKGARLTVRNSVAEGLNPSVPGRVPGRFVVIQDAADVLVENNAFAGTSGIRLERYVGVVGRDSFRVLRNRALNIDGRRSTGPDFSPDDKTAELVQFVQFVDVRGVPGIDVGWNEVRNEPGSSRVEDVISVFQSSGLVGAPIRIHDNFVGGAYPTNPGTDAYTGGGIMVGDGPAGGVAHVETVDNTVLDTTGHGIAVSAGSDVLVQDNRVLSGGRLADGTPIAGQNVGIYVLNLYQLPVFGPVEVVGNLIGWEQPRAGIRNDSYLPDASTVRDNTAFAGAITSAVLDSEYSLWRCRAGQAGVGIGAAPDGG